MSQLTINKKIATAIGVDFAIAKRLVDFYNSQLYVDDANPQAVRRGHKGSLVALGIQYDHLSHLNTIVTDDNHIHNHIVCSILAAAGYCRATGADAVFHQLINSK